MARLSNCGLWHGAYNFQIKLLARVVSIQVSCRRPMFEEILEPDLKKFMEKHASRMPTFQIGSAGSHIKCKNALRILAN